MVFSTIIYAIIQPIIISIWKKRIEIYLILNVIEILLIGLRRGVHIRIWKKLSLLLSDKSGVLRTFKYFFAIIK